MTYQRPLVCCAAFILGVALCSQSFAQKTEKKPAQSNVAYFAGGCFWCTQEIFEQAPGVISVVSGYIAGAETIQVTFDPARTSYNKLLKIFWRAHDPTEIDRQGPDTGKQYRSAIFYLNDEQHQTAEKSKAQLQASGTYHKPIATEITQAGRFSRAEESHQNFCRKNPNNRYVQETLVPKLKKLGLKTP
jgi:peptide-methionine (S)-S-oxide reductase